MILESVPAGMILEGVPAGMVQDGHLDRSGVLSIDDPGYR